MTPEIVDRGILHLENAGRVARVFRLDLLRSHEVFGFALVGEVQPVPIDDRTTPEQDPNPFEVSQSEIVEAAKLRDRHG